jgi:hypothetical protein
LTAVDAIVSNATLFTLASYIDWVLLAGVANNYLLPGALCRACQSCQ